MYTLLSIGIRLLFLVVIFYGKAAWLDTGFALSKMHIIYVLLFSIIMSFQYDILKHYIESKQKRKFLKCMLCILGILVLINVFYQVYPKYHLIHNWYETSYMSIKESILDFAFLPRFFDSLSLAKMMVLEFLLSSVFVYIAYLREKFSKKELGYILERALKWIFRYRLIILFYIFLLTIPSNLLVVRTWKYAMTGVMAIFLVLTILKNYLALRCCKIKEKEEYGKENLIVVLTPENYTFRLIDYVFNPLTMFYRYDNKNLVKSLLVSGKKYCFVLYEAFRYSLIDVTKYQNVAYLILLNDERLKDQVDFEKKIEKIIYENNHFMIYNSKLNFYLKTTYLHMKEKYHYRVQEKLDLKNILDMTSLKPSADVLKKNAKKLLDSIEKKDEEKNIYLKYGLNLILQSFNYIEYFYNLLKMCEYIIHYMGLKNILEKTEFTKEEIKAINQASWRFLIHLEKYYDKNKDQKMDKIASQKDICLAMINLNQLISSYKKEERVEKEVYAFKEDVCQVVADIRNEIVAHGVLSQEIAENYVNDLFYILFILVKEFEELNITITDDEKIKNIFEKDLHAKYRFSDKVFLYSNPVMKNQKIIYNECLNYESGRKRVIDQKVSTHMDVIYSVEDIEKGLRKRVMKNETANNKN